MNDLVYLDSKLVPLKKAGLSPLNSAFLFGESLLEAVPVYGGKPLFLQDHLDRLARGCEFLGWPKPSREVYGKAISLFSRIKGCPENFIIRFGLAQEMGLPGNPRAYSDKLPRVLGLIRPL